MDLIQYHTNQPSKELAHCPYQQAWLQYHVAMDTKMGPNSQSITIDSMFVYNSSLDLGISLFKLVLTRASFYIKKNIVSESFLLLI